MIPSGMSSLISVETSPEISSEISTGISPRFIQGFLTVYFPAFLQTHIKIPSKDSRMPPGTLTGISFSISLETSIP